MRLRASASRHREYSGCGWNRRPSDANVSSKLSRTAEERWYSALEFCNGLTTSCRATFYEISYCGLNESRYGQEIYLAPCPTQPPIQLISWGSFPGVKSPGYEADHSHQSIAEVKNEWTCNSTHPYAFMRRLGTIVPLRFYLSCASWVGRVAQSV